LKNKTAAFCLYIAWLATAAMLVYAVIEKHPYSYYTLLRWICCPVFAYSAVSAFRNESHSLDLDFWCVGRVIQSDFPCAFGSEHLGRRELVHNRNRSLAAHSRSAPSISYSDPGSGRQTVWRLLHLSPRLANYRSEQREYPRTEQRSFSHNTEIARAPSHLKLSLLE
jgi:Family of unknown function (DUF6804)